MDRAIDQGGVYLVPFDQPQRLLESPRRPDHIATRTDQRILLEQSDGGIFFNDKNPLGG